MLPLPRQHSVNRFRSFAAVATIIGLITPISTPVAAQSTPDGVDAMTDPPAAQPWEPSDDETIEEADIEATALALNTSKQQAERRIRIEGAAVSLQREVESRWPETTAGVWLSEAVEPALSVAFTENAEANVEQLSGAFPYPEILRPVTFARSLIDLQGIQRKIVAERTALQSGSAPAGLGPAIRGTDGHYDIEIRVQDNLIIVRAEPPSDELVPEFRARYGEPIEVERGVTEPDCTRVDCRFSMRGGLRIVGPSFGCSTAFTAFGPATGRRFVLSAGHCGGADFGSSRSNGGSQYGTMDRDVQEYRWDAERIVRTNQSWNEAGLVWVESFDQRPVHSYTGWSSQVIGTQVGKAGNTTGTTRGFVESKYYSPSYVPNGERFVTTSYCSGPGDSGGAIFRNNSAWGIHSGSTSSISCSDPQHFSLYGAIDYAIDELNVQLIGG